ncbi:probable RNA methyltransferase CG11342 [Anoplophora glabripennis]|uniref:probable RNA methyltransferase CG11342 n=1 Tax=Anoplophora glabripennis TaxID=217634 RepID=UPI000874679E|nr:probable RNA methyltransferase CG11342 [Anoplophora glabripennis]
MGENENLQFKGGNPGAVQFGNFINYYQFHPPEERINLLPKNVWKGDQPCIALDVGCNAGNLTAALYDFISSNITKDCSILGIDIDPVLIRRAEDTNNSDKLTYKCLDFMDENSRTEIITSYLKSKGVDKFNIVFCFSTTMWIHLNNGDVGLRKFLKEVSNICELLVIEPQPWKCYKTAVKRMKQNNFTFPLFCELRIRKNVEDEIEQYLTLECGLSKVAESNRTKWDRKLLIFQR